MDDQFKLRAATRTNEELQERVDNREKYLPETVEASVEELKFRGVEFSEEELTVIAEDMQARRSLAELKPDSYGMFGDRDKNNLIEDPDAPLLFSRRAIYAFSVIFSVFFGAVMLAMNVSKTSGKKNVIWVVLFGLAYTVATVMLLQNFKTSTGLTIIPSIAGAYLIEALFWSRYVGSSTLYRKRPIWIPLAIGIVVGGAFIFIAFYSGIK
jgi:lipopolysaccharide export LptBFGC system permease protein LptF